MLQKIQTMTTQQREISILIPQMVPQKLMTYLKKSLSKRDEIKNQHKRQVKLNLCSLPICLMRSVHHSMVLLGLLNFLKIQDLKRSNLNLLRLLKNHLKTFLKLSTISLTFLKLSPINLRLKILHLTL